MCRFAKVHDATVFTNPTLRAQFMGDTTKDWRISLIHPEKLRSHEAHKYLVPMDSKLVSSIEASSGLFVISNHHVRRNRFTHSPKRDAKQDRAS